MLEVSLPIFTLKRFKLKGRAQTIDKAINASLRQDFVRQCFELPWSRRVGGVIAALSVMAQDFSATFFQRRGGRGADTAVSA